MLYFILINYYKTAKLCLDSTFFFKWNKQDFYQEHHTDNLLQVQLLHFKATGCSVE